MVDDDANGIMLVPARAFERHEFIDGGDTVVVWLQGSDGRRVGVMMPRREMHRMVSALADPAKDNPSRSKPDQAAT